MTVPVAKLGIGIEDSFSPDSDNNQKYISFEFCWAAVREHSCLAKSNPRMHMTQSPLVLSFFCFILQYLMIYDFVKIEDNKNLSVLFADKGLQFLWNWASNILTSPSLLFLFDSSNRSIQS